MRVCRCDSLYAYVHIRLCIYGVYAFICSECTCVCVCLRTCVYVLAFMCVCDCVFMFVSVCALTRSSVCIYSYQHIPNYYNFYLITTQSLRPILPIVVINSWHTKQSGLVINLHFVSSVRPD